MKSPAAALAALVVSSAVAHADTPRSDASGDGDRARRRAKVATATRADGGITIDGRLDETTWAGAAWIDDFHQKEPAQDAPPVERTEIAIAFDGDALYVAARMHRSAGGRLDQPLTRRDETDGAERIIISLDPYRSRRTAYSFAVTAAGVRADWIHTDDSEYERDASWNPVWRAAARVEAGVWTAEMRIPFSQLRFPDDDVPVWGINFNRYVPRRREDDFWIVVPKDRTGWSSYMGELRGLAGIEQDLRLEVLPYVAGDLRVRSSELIDPDDPFAEEVGTAGRAGLDLKLGLGPSLTLDATINPDFGQVEADPAVVVLDAYEVTFPERRPFFVEGAQIFSSQPRSYFYSRRIGAAPRLRPDEVYVEEAEAARILGAAKLTGQIVPRTNIGAIAAVTAPSRVAVSGGPDTPTRRAEVAPLAGWGVARLERDLAGEASLAGVTITGVSRDVDDDAIEAALPRAAVSGGGDLRLRLDDGRTELFAAAGASAVAGSRDAIGAIQAAPAHYFQRPDAGHVELDPTRTLLTGWHGDLRAARIAGPWRMTASLAGESPGFELNDLGVLSSADDIAASAELQRVETRPSRRLHTWDAGLYAAEEWNFDGVRKPLHLAAFGGITLPSFVRAELAVGAVVSGQSDDATRGGPLMGVGGGADGEASIGRHGGRFEWVVAGGWEHRPGEVTGVGLHTELSWRVVDRVRLHLVPKGRFFTVGKQYVGAVSDTAGGDDTFGTRYLFATMTYRELITQVRGQLSLTPDLTLDGYLEAFASAGRFTGIGELPAPRAFELRRYDDVRRGDGTVRITDDGDTFEVGEPDFTFLSLRSTVVLRWELRPGSVLYAVWQQDRSRGDARARTVGPGLTDDVVTAPGEHVFALKLSYWWSP